MSRKVVTPLDFTQLEILNVRLQQLGSDPGSPVEGQLWFRSDVHRPKWYDGTSVQYIYPMASTATANTGVLRDGSGNFSATTITANLTGTASQATALDDGTTTYRSGSYYLSRTNHTGTQLANTISNFDTQVRTSRLDQMAAPTASVSMGSQLLTNLLDPVSPQDAATKAYVDAARSGLDVKASVRVVTNAALAAYTRTLNVIQSNSNVALAAIDSVTLIVGDRLLLKDGASASDNGIYTVTQVGSGAAPFILTRATDADTSAEVTSGMFTFAEEGTVWSGSGFVLTTANPITLNTTGLVFTQFSGAGEITAGNGITKTGNTLSVNAAARLTFTGVQLDLASGIVTAGTYSSVTVDTYGRATAGADIITSNGFVVRTGASTFAPGTITGTASRITVTGGTGTTPTIDIHASYVGQSSITTLGTIGTGVWQGTLVGVTYGGTGVSGASAANGSLLIGNGSGYTLATLTAGANAGVTITNGAGTITLSTVQDIRTTATPVFVSADFTGLTTNGLVFDNGTSLAANANFTFDGTTVALTKRFAYTATTPATLAASANDYNPGDAVEFRISASSPFSITGFANGTSGRVIRLTNVGASAITLTNADALSSAANRISTLDALSLVLGASDSATLIYDSTSTVWRVVDQTVQRAISTTSITSGTLPIARGGTNSNTALSGSTIMISNGTGIVQGAAGTTVQVLHGNAGGAPTYGAVVLTTDVSGILPIANGGTNSTTALSGSSIMVSNGTNIVQGAAGTTTTVLHGNASGVPTYGAVSLTADITGTLGIGNGGTGQITAALAFNALSPMTTAGDIIYGGVSGAGTRLAPNASATKMFLNMTSSAPSWAALVDADIPSTLSANARVAVSNAGVAVGTRRGINFIAGTNISYTIADNSGAERVDVTINASGGVAKYVTSIGNGSLTTFTVTHALGTLDVTVTIYDNSTLAEILGDVIHATTTTLTLNFAVAPTTNQYRVVVTG